MGKNDIYRFTKGTLERTGQDTYNLHLTRAPGVADFKTDKGMDFANKDWLTEQLRLFENGATKVDVADPAQNSSLRGNQGGVAIVMGNTVYFVHRSHDAPSSDGKIDIAASRGTLPWLEQLLSNAPEIVLVANGKLLVPNVKGYAGAEDLRQSVIAASLTAPISYQEGLQEVPARLLTGKELYQVTVEEAGQVVDQLQVSGSISPRTSSFEGLMYLVMDPVPNAVPVDTQFKRKIVSVDAESGNSHVFVNGIHIHEAHSADVLRYLATLVTYDAAQAAKDKVYGSRDVKSEKVASVVRSWPTTELGSATGLEPLLQ